MPLRIECSRFPTWDGAEVSEHRPCALRVLQARSGLPGLVFRDEVRALVGVDEDEDATLYLWDGEPYRWLACEAGPVHLMRDLLRTYRRAYPHSAFWIKPDTERPGRRPRVLR